MPFRVVFIIIIKIPAPSKQWREGSYYKKDLMRVVMIKQALIVSSPIGKHQER